MAKEFLNPQNIYEPLGSYSHQIEISGNERILVLSGQIGMRQDGTAGCCIREHLEKSSGGGHGCKHKQTSKTLKF
jgi:enamine deaminase RidA (YjgF/YER057c/UK114 family)